MRKGLGACCYVAACVLCLIVGVIQATRATNAGNINNDFKEVLPNYTDAYDACMIGAVKLSTTGGSLNTVDAFTNVDVDNLESFGKDVFGESWSRCDSFKCDGTGWTFVWQYNSAIMITMSVNYLVLALGSISFKARLIGTILNFVLALCNIIGAIIALNSVYDSGDNCTENTLMVSEYKGGKEFVKDGYTYADEGDLIYALAVIQILIGSL